MIGSFIFQHSLLTNQSFVSSNVSQGVLYLQHKHADRKWKNTLIILPSVEGGSGVSKTPDDWVEPTQRRDQQLWTSVTRCCVECVWFLWWITSLKNSMWRHSIVKRFRGDQMQLTWKLVLHLHCGAWFRAWACLTLELCFPTGHFISLMLTVPRCRQ